MTPANVLDINKLRELYIATETPRKRYREIFEDLQKTIMETYGFELPEGIRRLSRNMYHEINSDTPYVLDGLTHGLIEKMGQEHETIIIKNPAGIYNLCAGLGGSSLESNTEFLLKNIIVEGDVGLFYGGYAANRYVTHHIKGSAGRSFMDNAQQGKAIIEGIADDSAAQVNHGADFLFKDLVGPRLAWAQRGGNVVTLNNLPYNAGMFMAKGTIITLGEKVEDDIGPGILGGTIYTPINHDKILGKGAAIIPVRPEDYARIAGALNPFIEELGISIDGEKIDHTRFNHDNPMLEINGKMYDFSKYFTILPKRDLKKEQEIIE